MLYASLKWCRHFFIIYAIFIINAIKHGVLFTSLGMQIFEISSNLLFVLLKCMRLSHESIILPSATFMIMSHLHEHVALLHHSLSGTFVCDWQINYAAHAQRGPCRLLWWELVPWQPTLECAEDTPPKLSSLITANISHPASWSWVLHCSLTHLRFMLTLD